MTQKQAGEQRLEELIAERGMSQRQLAEKAGVSRSVISLALHGASRIHRESASKLARTLGVEVDEILASEPGDQEDEESGGSMRLVAGQSEVARYPEDAGTVSVGAEAAPKAVASQSGGNQATMQADLPSGMVSAVGLRNCRSFAGLSQAELSRRSRVKDETIRKGERSGKLSTRTAEKLARALSVSVADFAEVEQSRFPEREKQVVASPAAGTAQQTPPPDTASANSTTGESQSDASSESAREGIRGPLRLEVAEPVLRRVDRILDILEAFVRRRRDG